MFCSLLLLADRAPATEPPRPLAPLPTRAQLDWADKDLALFINIGIGTFTGQEHGTGKEDPKAFNPAKLDVQQWVALAKECGFRRIILSAKSHDGFCLWPSRYSDYTVKNSAWRNGKGDLVKEFTDACQAAGLEAGFYLSCQDLHSAAYGTPDYNKIYIGQLTELLSNYGPVSELRFDGAGGVGSNAVGAIDPPPPDRKQVYDWTNYFATVSRLQPQTIMVSVVGPGARWNGNNIGHTGNPIWPQFDLRSVPGPEPASPAQLQPLNVGDPHGTVWLPPECFVRMRPHWTWRAEDDTNLVAPDRLFSSWCKSVGHGCVLLLNVALNRDGLIPDADAQRLRELHAAIHRLFATDFAAGKPATASNVRGKDPAFAAANAVDGDPKTYWATDDANDCWLEVDLGKPVRFNTSVLREPVWLGPRVSAYRIEAWRDGRWQLVVHGSNIGQMKLERFNAVTADKVRLVIEQSRACPLISQFSLHLH